MPIKNALRVPLIFVLALSSSACSETPRVTEYAGTGSAGGNPALAFSHDSASRYDSVEWQPPVMNVETVRLTMPDDDGLCGTGSADPLAHEGEITFDGLSEIVFDDQLPCVIAFEPPLESPAVVFEAIVDESKDLRIELWSGGPIEIEFDQLERVESAEDVFFVIEIDRMLDGIDFRYRLSFGDSAVISNRPPVADPGEADRIEANFLAAARVFLDPTPGDGRLDRDERVPENVIGTVRLLRPQPMISER